MTGIAVDLCDGNLAIDGVPLRTPAWYVTDLVPLWQGGNRRGSDRVIPGAAGVIANPRRRTVTTYSLPMLIVGEVDQDGDPHGDVWDGLQANYDLLIAQLVANPGGATGTRTAILTMPNGATRTGPVHVLDIPFGVVTADSGFVAARATLDLSIPGGRLV